MSEENDTGLSSPEELASDDVKSHKAWIRYRTELLHPRTGEKLHRFDSKGPELIELQDDNDDDDPTFELVTIYNARESGDKTKTAKPVIGSAPTRILRIYSPAVINALRSVVEYYPDQDLSGTIIKINWPYPILVHHYTELRDFKTRCDNEDSINLCVREKNASEHIALVLRFLDDNIMERVRAEEERNKRGYCTFEDMWVSHKPGRTVAIMDRSQKNQWASYVIYSMSGGILNNPPEIWTILAWRLAFDGKYLGRVRDTLFSYKFDGESAFNSKKILFGNFDGREDDVLSDLALNGKKYWKLVRKQCRHHNGKSMEFPYNDVRCKIINTCLLCYFA